MAVIKGKGLPEVLRNLSKAVKGIEGKTADGLLEAAVFIKGESQEVVPHRDGFLIRSAFSDVDRNTLVARVGYTAKYAPYVHEMPEWYNYTKPNTGPKFLERPLKENHRTILHIIANRAKFK